jgi:hypothetical protein
VNLSSLLAWPAGLRHRVPSLEKAVLVSAAVLTLLSSPHTAGAAQATRRETAEQSETGVAPIAGVDSIGCLATADAGEFYVRMEIRGCFGGSTQWVTLAWNGDAGAASGRIWASDDVRRAIDLSPLPLVRLRDAVARVVGAATRAAVPAGCRSTSRHETQLHWRCEQAEGPAILGRVTYSTTECVPDEVRHVSWFDELFATKPYVPAIATANEAKAVLEALERSEGP